MRRWTLFTTDQLVNILSLHGILISTLGILASLLITWTLLVAWYQYPNYVKLYPSLVVFGASVSVIPLLLSSTWLYLNIQLRRDVINGLKKICYTLAGIEILILTPAFLYLCYMNIVELVNHIVRLKYWREMVQCCSKENQACTSDDGYYCSEESLYDWRRWYSAIFIFITPPAILSGSHLFFSSLLIHGIRTNNRSFATLFLKYNIFLLIILMIGGAVGAFFFTKELYEGICVSLISPFLIVYLFMFYHHGYFLVLDQKMKITDETSSENNQKRVFSSFIAFIVISFLILSSYIVTQDLIKYFYY